MAEIFTAFLFTSLLGTIIALVLILLKPFTKRLFPASWHYYSWLIVLIIMMLPVRFDFLDINLWLHTQDEANILHYHLEENHVSGELQGIDATEQNLSNPSIIVAFVRALQLIWLENASTFSYIWLFVALTIFSFKVCCYIRFIHNVRKKSRIITCPSIKEYTSRRVTIRTSEMIYSPILVGVFFPTLLLPKRSVTPSQLSNILAHEMTHLNRHDILYKWFLTFVKAVHWFNPAIYMIGNQINLDCEISCDLAVVKNMTSQEEQNYMETILSLLTSSNSKPIPLTTNMTGNKKTLITRFTMIKNKKNINKKTYVFSGVAATILLFTSLFASGIFADAFLGNDSKIKESTNNLAEEQQLDNTQLEQTQNEETSPTLIPEQNNSSNEELNISVENVDDETNEEAQPPLADTSQPTLNETPQAALLATDFIWPTESRQLSNRFGTRVHPITNETSTHNGVDIVAEEGSNVYSSIAGTVVEADYNSDNGNYIVVENAAGIKTQYSHLSSIEISVGDSVQQGNVIGKVGKTGKATGPHLHFSIEADDKYYNPEELAY